jgi:hypothetical protein
MCVECVEHGTAVVLAAGMRRCDGKYFITFLGNLGTICVIIELDEASWKFGDSGGGDVPMEGSCVNQRIHRGRQDSSPDHPLMADWGQGTFLRAHA